MNPDLPTPHREPPASDEAPSRPEPAASMGRLAAGPHPVLFQLLYEPQLARDQVEVLPRLLRIDAAHVLMLAESGILARETAAGLLRVNREMLARVQAGEPAIEPPPVHRGLYMVYERHAIDRLGPEAGGAAHVARSRNDLNATVARMRLRDQLLTLLRAGDELARTALWRAGEHASTPMSGFTHFQPAQPTTLGHYLAGFASELLRTLELLAGAFANVNRSPLGACAGWGTSFPIQPERTASLLGFDAVIANSLDAVASRDYAVQVLAALASLGILLTRLSFDLQTWGSHAYGFLRWPDRLVSTSSIMPQKRNAFVLENIRGQAAGPAGALSATLLGLKSTPFSNSVEAGSEALAHLWPALSGAQTSVQLMELMLREVEVDSDRMSRFLAGGEVTMTALADYLVERHGLPFRTAHEAVGNLLQRLPDEGARSVAAIREGLEEVLRDLTGRGVSLEDAGIARALDPLACVQAARHGGGPAPESVQAQLAGLDEARRSLSERTVAWRRRLDQADARLDEAVGSLLDAQPPVGDQR